MKESICLTLDEELIEQLKKQALKEKRSISWIVNELCKKVRK